MIILKQIAIFFELTYIFIVNNHLHSLKVLLMIYQGDFNGNLRM